MKYFSSSISNKKLSDFQKYDATIKKYEDRLELVVNMINEETDTDTVHAFFSTYFDNYYNVSPSQNGFLSESDAVCKTIEGLGTYLLNSKDIESNRKVKYRFWKNEREYKKYKESHNINATTLEAGLDEGIEVIDMFYNPDDKNYKLDNAQRLFAKDLKDVKEIRVLQDGIDMVKSESFIKKVQNKIDEVMPEIDDERELARLKSIRGNVEKYCNQWASNMGDNQILIKEAVKRPIRFKSVAKGEGAPDKLAEADFDNIDAVREMLKSLAKSDLMSDFGIMVFDLNKLIDEVVFKSEDLKIINLFRQGYTQSEVCEVLSLKRYSVTRSLDRVAKKIVDHYIEKKVIF